MLIAVTAMFLQQTCGSIARALPAVLAPLIIAELHADAAWVGIYFSLTAFAGLIGQLGSGGFIIRHGAIRMSQIALLSVSGGMAVAVIGGAAGAFPPVVGWAAVTGSVDLMPLLLFAIVFFWTPPHFWSLALFANSDYQRAGVPMLPVVAGAKETRRQIVIYTLLLVPLSLAPWLLGFSGLVYGLSAAALGVGFIVSVWRVATDRQDASGVSQTNDAPARMAFKFSILYLFALFAALAVDRFVG